MLHRCDVCPYVYVSVDCYPVYCYMFIVSVEWNQLQMVDALLKTIMVAFHVL